MSRDRTNSRRPPRTACGRRSRRRSASRPRTACTGCRGAAPRSGEGRRRTGSRPPWGARSAGRCSAHTQGGSTNRSCRGRCRTRRTVHRPFGPAEGRCRCRRRACRSRRLRRSRCPRRGSCCTRRQHQPAWRICRCTLEPALARMRPRHTRARVDTAPAARTEEAPRRRPHTHACPPRAFPPNLSAMLVPPAMETSIPRCGACQEGPASSHVWKRRGALRQGLAPPGPSFEPSPVPVAVDGIARWACKSRIRLSICMPCARPNGKRLRAS